jgi:hypothetical protein
MSKKRHFQTEILRAGSGWAAPMALAAATLMQCWGQEVKMVFTRGESVFVAKEDGSEEKELPIADSTPKSRLRWSPDGHRLLWLAPDNHEKRSDPHVNFVIASETGRILNTFPVFTLSQKGETITGVMRGVEDMGWYSNTAVYADGSVNPWYGNYMAIDVSSGKPVQFYYDGAQFATCPAKSSVAYLTGGTLPGSDLMLNGMQIPSVSLTSFEDVQSDLLWSPGCTHVALLRRHSGQSLFFMVVQREQLEAEIELPAAYRSIRSFVATANGYVIDTSNGTLIYTVGSRKLRLVTGSDTAAKEVLVRLKRRQQWVWKSGGDSADWWPPISMSTYLGNARAPLSKDTADDKR